MTIAITGVSINSFRTPSTRNSSHSVTRLKWECLLKKKRSLNLGKTQTPFRSNEQKKGKLVCRLHQFLITFRQLSKFTIQVRRTG
jgi:hypothetical protein